MNDDDIIVGHKYRCYGSGSIYEVSAIKSVDGGPNCPTKVVITPTQDRSDILVWSTGFFKSNFKPHTINVELTDQEALIVRKALDSYTFLQAKFQV